MEKIGIVLLVVVMSGLSSKVEHKRLEQLADFGSSPGAGTNIAILDFSPSLQADIKFSVENSID